MTAPRFLDFDLGSTLIDELPAMRMRAQLTCERLAATGIPLLAEDLLNRCFERCCIDANSPYHAVLRELLANHDAGIRPEDVVLFDDSERNVAGARAFGWRAVHYREFADLEGFLKETTEREASG